MEYYYDALEWVESYQVEIDAIDAELAAADKLPWFEDNFIVVTNRWDDLS